MKKKSKSSEQPKQGTMNEHSALNRAEESDDASKSESSSEMTVPELAEAPINDTDLIQMVDLDAITIDAGTASRELHEEVVQEYQDLWKEETKFPPVILYTDDERNYLADGFHRIEAARRAGIAQIPALVYDGGHQEALKHSLSANELHGLRRSIADKRYAVNRAIEEFPGLSAREISKLCAVSHTFVAGLLKQLKASTGNVASSPSQGEGKDGKTRKQRTNSTKTTVAADIGGDFGPEAVSEQIPVMPDTKGSDFIEENAKPSKAIITVSLESTVKRSLDLLRKQMLKLPEQIVRNSGI